MMAQFRIAYSLNRPRYLRHSIYGDRRFQMRADNHVISDLFVPGLFRADLAPGESITLIATAEQDDDIDFDVSRSFERGGAEAAVFDMPPPDQFTLELFLKPNPGAEQASPPETAPDASTT